MCLAYKLDSKCLLFLPRPSRQSSYHFYLYMLVTLILYFNAKMIRLFIVFTVNHVSWGSAIYASSHFYGQTQCPRTQKRVAENKGPLLHVLDLSWSNYCQNQPTYSPRCPTREGKQPQKCNSVADRVNINRSFTNQPLEERQGEPAGWLRS